METNASFLVGVYLSTPYCTGWNNFSYISFGTSSHLHFGLLSEFWNSNNNSREKIIIIIIIIIFIIIIIIIITISFIIYIYQQKRNRNTRELFYTEHEQRFSSTRKCLSSSWNLNYPLNFSVTFTEKIWNFPTFNVLLYRNYFIFPWHFPENLSRFAEEFPVKQAFDLGHLRVAIPLARKCIYRCYLFNLRERV